MLIRNIIFMGFVALSMLLSPVYSAENAESNYLLGVRAYYEKDFIAAFDAWSISAEHGDPDAQYNLGVMYLEGRYIEKNYILAHRWFKKAARNQHAKAQYNIGHMKFSGLGVDKNVNSAINWWSKSANGGYPQAQFNYGRALIAGLGVKKDVDAGLKMIQLAAKGDDEGAKIFLSNNAEQVAKLEQVETVGLSKQSAPEVKASKAMPITETLTKKSKSVAKVVDKRQQVADSNKALTEVLTQNKQASSAGPNTTKKSILDNNSWLFSQAKEAYLIRVFSVLNHAKAVQLVKSEPFNRNGQLFTSQMGGRHWIYLLIGPYVDKTSAKNARLALPSEYVKDARVQAVTLATKNRCAERGGLNPGEAEGLNQFCK